jgi:hypothetical protein
MHLRRLLVFATLGLGLVACDAFYGVSRNAYVSTMPFPSEVLAVIRSTPGVDSVTYDRFNAGASPVDSNSVITFSYRGRGGVHGILQFIRHPGQLQEIQYTNGIMHLNEEPHQSDVDATYPVMLAIETRLEAIAGLTDLRSRVTEQCYGVRCPDPR